jgi:hypothetical protein
MEMQLGNPKKASTRSETIMVLRAIWEVTPSK